MHIAIRIDSLRISGCPIIIYYTQIYPHIPVNFKFFFEKNWFADDFDKHGSNLSRKFHQQG